MDFSDKIILVCVLLVIGSDLACESFVEHQYSKYNMVNYENNIEYFDNSMEEELPSKEDEAVPQRVETFPLADGEKEIISYIISGEAGGEPMEGKMAVAQCLLNAMKKDGLTASEVKKQYKYAGYNPDFKSSNPAMYEEVLEAIERVFTYGERVTEENILYFYAPKYSKGQWHETQKYAGTFGSQKFFAPKEK